MQAHGFDDERYTPLTEVPVPNVLDPDGQAAVQAADVVQGPAMYPLGGA